MWDSFPDILQEVEEDQLPWFQNAEVKVKQLHAALCETLDLIHATRAGNKKPRLSREAILASQAKNYNSWINSILERILRNNWMHPYISMHSTN